MKELEPTAQRLPDYSGRATKKETSVTDRGRRPRARMNAWGRKVDELLYERGLTQAMLADRMLEMGMQIGHPRNSLGRAMHESKYITFMLLTAVADGLELSPEERIDYYEAAYQAGKDGLAENGSS